MVPENHNEGVANSGAPLLIVASTQVFQYFGVVVVV
jgi:hypothetical protein